MSTQIVKTGKIKRTLNKGYGFITDSDNNEDVFFHLSGCVVPSFDELRVGMTVNYTKVETKDGRKKAIEIAAI